MREVTNDIDKEFDEMFKDIDVSENIKSEPNSVSMTQILDSYMESKENY
jgi:hypothetical protein